MIGKLLKKEFALCMHASVWIYMIFAIFVLIPNYPYEVAFFFSAMGAFFICIKARENGDLDYTCALPVKRSSVPVARILLCVVMQGIFMFIVAAGVTVKQVLVPAGELVNMAGNSANTALIGWGFVILGVFDIVFFPLYFRNPDKVGVPFIIATVVTVFVIGILMVSRFALPPFKALNMPDPEYIGAKLGVLSGGAAFYAASVFAACKVSSKLFCENK